MVETQTVFLTPGWNNWKNPNNEATARYAEYKNYGPGADTTKRVSWCRQLTDEEAKKFTFYQGDVEGKSNVERAFDDYLRGKPGVRYLRRNAKGTIDGVLKEEPPQQGANVFLTIDARIQAITDEALRAVSRAGAVVVDPNNGNILAMASVPSIHWSPIGLCALAFTKFS